MEDSRQSIGRLTQLSSTMNAELDEANDKIEVCTVVCCMYTH